MPSPQPGPLDDPIDHLDAAVVRRMLEAGGLLLDLVVSDAPPLVTLRSLCSSLRGMVGADVVTLQLLAIPPVRATPVIRADQAGVTILQHGDHVTSMASSGPSRRVSLTSSAGDQAAIVSITWPDSHAPTETDRWIIDRFGLLVSLVAQRRVESQRRLDAVARERETLAGEIHDDPIQVITALNLGLQRLARTLPDDHQREQVEGLRRQASYAIERLRHLLFSLHPSSLEDEGLTGALERYCEMAVEPAGIAWTVDEDVDDPIPAEIAALIFRLGRDAIFNAVKHADPAHVTVELTESAHVARLVVRDDGIGFDPEGVTSSMPGHFGLEHARTLASLAGGTYTISSRPGDGTEIVIEVPTL